MTTRPPPASSEQAGVGVVTRPDLRWKRCDVKSTNLLANVVALDSAVRRGSPRGPVDRRRRAGHRGDPFVGPVGPGRSARGDARTTRPSCPGPPATDPGSRRRRGNPFAENRVTLGEFIEADEAILVGTTIEVLPIVRVDGRPIAGGRPGPITRRLQAAYRAGGRAVAVGVSMADLGISMLRESHA